jgi:hypothetical protein
VLLGLLGPLERHGLIRKEETDLVKLLEKYGDAVAKEAQNARRAASSGGVSNPPRSPNVGTLQRLVPDARWFATPHGVQLLELIERSSESE